MEPPTPPAWARGVLEDVVVAGSPRSSSVGIAGVICRARGIDQPASSKHRVEGHAGIRLACRSMFATSVVMVATPPAGECIWDGLVGQWFPNAASLAEQVQLATNGGRPRVVVDIPRFAPEMQEFATTQGVTL